MDNKKLQEGREVAIKEYNKIRRKNGLPDFLADAEMNNDGQTHAEYLVKSNKFETTTMGKYSTNIVTSVEPRLFDGIKDSIERLHKMEGKRYYLKSGCNKIGVGLSRNEAEKKWIIVFFYEVPSSSKETQQGTKDLRNIFSKA